MSDKRRLLAPTRLFKSLEYMIRAYVYTTAVQLLWYYLDLLSSKDKKI